LGLTFQMNPLRAALLLVQIAAALFVGEAAFRAYWAHEAPHRLTAMLSAQTGGPTSAKALLFNPLRVPDPYVGYRYGPNREGDFGEPWNSHWQTNSHGHVSVDDYPTRKPAGEFRIAAVGDSFTANITSNIRWTEELQRILNSSPQWKVHVGGKFTRVINFGVDGTGIEHFAGMVTHYVPAFEPDIIIVNFITDDFRRKMRYQSNETPALRDQTISSFITEITSSIKWLEPCSLMLSLIERWPWAGKCRSIPIDLPAYLVRRSSERYAHPTHEDAVKHSAAALHDMIKVPSVLFLQQPTFEQTEGLFVDIYQGLIEDTAKLVPDWTFVDMLEQIKPTREEARRWFYIPADRHYNGYGNIIYARAVANVVLGQSSAEMR
jgi:hypothetical protein